MKKIVFFLFLTLGWLGVKSQPVDNKGGWFMFKNANYSITKGNIVEIAKGGNLMKPWQAYKLANGEEFIAVSPQLWGNMIEETITLIDGTKPVNWVDSIAYHGIVVPWDDNISGTVTNYGVRKNGESFPVSSNYTGGENVWIFLYKGYPIIKVKNLCLNPLRPNNILQKPQLIPVAIAPAPTLVPTAPVDVNVKVDILGVGKTKQSQPSNITNNYYSQGYDSYGQEILYNPYTESFGFYNRTSMCYDLLSWGQAAMRGFYRSLDDCRMRQNYCRVGDYYNEITNITNINNSINNSYNTTNNTRVDRHQPKPETVGPKDAPGGHGAQPTTNNNNPTDGQGFGAQPSNNIPNDGEGFGKKSARINSDIASARTNSSRSPYRDNPTVRVNGTDQIVRNDTRRNSSSSFSSNRNNLTNRPSTQSYARSYGQSSQAYRQQSSQVQSRQSYQRSGQNHTRNYGQSGGGMSGGSRSFSGGSSSHSGRR
jgi:hypothetical protein